MNFYIYLYSNGHKSLWWGFDIGFCVWFVRDGIAYSTKHHLSISPIVCLQFPVALLMSKPKPHFHRHTICGHKMCRFFFCAAVEPLLDSKTLSISFVLCCCSVFTDTTWAWICGASAQTDERVATAAAAATRWLWWLLVFTSADFYYIRSVLSGTRKRGHLGCATQHNTHRHEHKNNN